MVRHRYEADNAEYIAHLRELRLSGYWAYYDELLLLAAARLIGEGC